MENIDVSNFLNLHSLGNHEDFCLAYVFTYRDFTGGTLGLAWVASASGEFRIRTRSSLRKSYTLSLRAVQVQVHAMYNTQVLPEVFAKNTKRTRKRWPVFISRLKEA